VLEQVFEEEEILDRVAGIDVGKAELMCCIRVSSATGSGLRAQEVQSWRTVTGSIVALAQKLVELRIERVIMEATSDYWRPVFYILEAHGLDVWLVNARHVKHLPGRPKTDKLDAVWLAKCAERQLVEPCFVPPPPMRRLRDLTRYRVDLVGARTAEKARVEKFLESALY
jgi:transposase